MRCLLLILTILAAGCFEAKTSRLAVGGDDDDVGSGSGPGFPSSECISDEHCTLAAATCCECPSFAIGTADGVYESCSEVECQPPDSDPERACPTNLTAACRDQRCVIACAPVACETSCADGYATDANGCVTCACATPTAGGCVADADCTQVNADCCGCEHGGIDTAVLASEAAGYESMLGCSSNSQCPSVNTCQPDAIPRCLQGHCELSATALPATACGRPDLAACPTGQQCIVNSNDDASMLGVGVCGTL